MEGYKAWILIVLMFIQAAAQGKNIDNCFQIMDLYIKDSSDEAKTVPCEPDWYHFEGKCYNMPRDETGFLELNWEDAAEKCVEYGARLVTIRDKEIQKFITTNFLLAIRKYIWIGLHKPSGQYSYEWHDGSSVGYSNWGWLQPSRTYNGKNEDCIDLMYDKGNLDGKWNDVHCTDYKMPFVCQKDQDSTLRSPDARYCPEDLGGGRRFRDSCFHFVSEEKSWDEAEAHCAKHYNGHLATISDRAIKYYIGDILDESTREDYWIGVHLQDVTYQKWSSGKYVDLVLARDLNEIWKYDYRSSRYTDACVFLSEKNDFQIDACQKSKHFICEVPLIRKSPSLKQLKASLSECPGNFEDWVDLGGDKCYYFSEDSAYLSWQEANFKCMERGSVLASIHSQEESDALQSFYSYDEPKVHIGLLRNQNDQFIWIDGSKVDFQSWMSGEPNDVNERCVELRTSSMEWNDIPCSASKKYICSVKKIPRTRPGSSLGIYKLITSQSNKQSLGIYGQLNNSINVALSKKQEQSSSTGVKNELIEKEIDSKGGEYEILNKEGVDKPFEIEFNSMDEKKDTDLEEFELKKPSRMTDEGSFPFVIV